MCTQYYLIQSNYFHSPHWSPQHLQGPLQPRLQHLLHIHLGAKYPWQLYMLWNISTGKDSFGLLSDVLRKNDRMKNVKQNYSQKMLTIAQILNKPKKSLTCSNMYTNKAVGHDEVKCKWLESVKINLKTTSNKINSKFFFTLFLMKENKAYGGSIKVNH